MHDVILVGGGLANGLIAWRLRQLRPDLRILLAEQGGSLGGNHTWSFYQTDLAPAQLAWLQPMVVRHWPGYEVRFPAHRRTLGTGCYSISSERFHEVLTAALGDAVLLDAAVDIIDRNSVQVAGQRLEARVVIDGRGPRASTHMRCAYQKFVGREVVLREPHGQTLPIVMDATVAQGGGYRFVYTLPFDDKRMLVEDTCYSDGPELDAAAVGDHIDAYIASRGWTVASVAREETGVLPIALSGDIEAFWRDKPGALPCSGLRAGLFHATTGYSLLYAVRLADLIAGIDTLDADAVYQATKACSVRQWRSQRFMRLLNRMLFYASPPLQRYRILQRFYRLPQQLIERFYAAQPTWFDQLRILTGKPPVPVFSAFRAALETGKESSSRQS
jgi:lycopene beta-cyclase